MFTEPLLDMTQTSSFKMWSIFCYIYANIFVIITFFLFLFSQTIFTGGLFILGILHHYYLLKMNLREKISISRIYEQRENLLLYFRNPENVLMKVIIFYNFLFLLGKTMCQLSIYLKNKNEILMFCHLKRSRPGNHSTLFDFLFPEESFLVPIIMTLALSIFYFICRQSPNHVNLPQLKIIKALIHSKMIPFFYILVYSLIIYKVITQRTWSNFIFFENFALVVLMIICLMRCQQTGNFTTEKYLNYHKYVCMVKLFAIVIKEGMLKFEENPNNKAVVFQFLNQFPSYSDNSLILVTMLYFAHSYLNILLKFRSRFVDPLNQGLNLQLKNKPLFMTHFARRLLVIMGSKAEICSNLDLNSKFYSDLKKIGPFRRYFESSARNKLKYEEMPLKKRIYLPFRKLGNTLINFRLEILKIILNFSLIYYLVSLLVKTELFSLFRLMIVFVILLYPSFKAIYRIIFVLGIFPSFLLMFFMILPHFFPGIADSKYNRFIEKITKISGIEYDNESIKTRAFEDLAYSGILTFYLIILFFLNSRKWKVTMNDVQSFSADNIFIFCQCIRIIFIGVQFLMVCGLISEILQFINFLNTFILISVIVYMVLQNQTGYKVVCETVLFVFLMRFMFRFLKMFMPVTKQDNFLVGTFLNEPFCLGFNEASSIMNYQWVMLQYNFWVVCSFFAISRLVDWLGDEPPRGFSNRSAGKVFLRLTSAVHDIFRFISSMKLFILYFYTLNNSAYATTQDYLQFEYFLTLIVLLLHLAALKFPSKHMSYFFYIVFGIYTLFALFLFIHNYKTGFSLEYLKTNQNSMERLLPFLVKAILSLIAIKEMKINVPSQKTEFLQITKDKFYFSFLKFFAVFFKEFFLITLMRDLLIPPNTAKILYLILYCYYFNAQFSALGDILKQFQFLQIIRLKIYYFKNYLLEPNFVSKKEFHNKEYENAEIVYLKLFTRKTYHAFYKRVEKVWVLMLSLVICYMTIMFLITTDQTDSLRDQQILRLIISFWKSQKLISIEYQKTVILFNVTVFELFFINLLVSNWSEEHEEAIKPTVSCVITRYLKLFENNPDLINIAGVNIKESESIENDLKIINQNTSSDYNFQLEKYQSNDDPEVKDTAKKELTLNERYFLLYEHRSKFSLLQIINSLLHSSRYFILLPFFVYFMSSPVSFCSALFVFFLYFWFTESDIITTISICNKVIIIICFTCCILKTIVFGQDFNTINSHTFQAFALHFSKGIFSFLGITVFYIIMVKLFYLLILSISELVMVNLEKIPPSFWDNIKAKKIRGNTYFVIEYFDSDFSFYTPFYWTKNWMVEHMADIFYMLVLLSYFLVGGIVPTFLFGFFVILKLFIVWSSNLSFSDSLITRFKIIYIGCSILNFGSILAFHLGYFKFTALAVNFGKFLFPTTFILNLLILDAINSPDFQKESSRIRNFLSFYTRLSILNGVQQENEEEIIGAAKEKLIYSRIESKVDYFLKKKKSSIFENSNSGSLIDLCLFSKSKDYLAYLKKRLGWFKSLHIDLIFSIRKKITQHVAKKSNVLAKLNKYITRNKSFVSSNYELDYCSLVNEDFSQMEEIVTKIEAVKKNSFSKNQQNYVAEIMQRIVLAREREKRNQTRHTLRSNSSPSTPGILSNTLHSINKALYARLTRNEIEEKFAQIVRNQFGDNMFKVYLSEGEYLLLRNFDSIEESLISLNVVQLTLKESLFCLIGLFRAGFEHLGTIIVVILCCFNSGFVSMIYAAILIFGLLLDRQVQNLRLWKIIYFIFHINFMIIMSLNSNFYFMSRKSENFPKDAVFPSSSMARFAMFFYGNINGTHVLVLYLTLEMVFLQLSQSGFWDVSKRKIESHSKALYRVARLPSGFFKLFSRENKLILSKVNVFENLLKKDVNEKSDEKTYTMELVNLSQRKSAIYRQNKDKFLKFLLIFGQIAKCYNEDDLTLSNKSPNNYLWRNFSYITRKNGKNFHISLMILLLTTLIYFCVFFFKLNGSEASVGEILKNNEINAMLGINVSFIFLAICIEHFLYCHKSRFWIEASETQRMVTSRYLVTLKAKSPNFKVLTKTLSDLFRKIARRVIYINRMRKPTVRSLKSDFIKNPMLVRFIFTICFFLYWNMLIFLVIPLFSNDSVHDHATEVIFCNSYYYTSDHASELKSNCNSVASNRFLQILLLFGNSYVMLSIWQIRQGFSSRFHFKANVFSSISDTLSFYLYHYPPFIKELATIINTLASPSSLPLFNWFKVEDIRTSLVQARLTQMRNPFNSKRIDKRAKRLSGISFLLFFFALLIGPLFLFSDFLFSSETDSVQSANITLMIHSRNSNYTLYRNFGYKINSIQKSQQIFQKFSKNEKLMKFDSDSFQKISFGQRSHSEMPLTRETIQNIKEDFNLYKNSHFSLVLDLRTNLKSKVEIIFDFDIQENDSKNFIRILNDPTCSQKSSVRLNLHTGARLLNLRRAEEGILNKVESDSFSNIQNSYVLIIHCDPHTQKISFELSEELNHNLSFIVLNKNITKSISLLQQFFEHKLSLKYIYLIILFYIGSNLIRHALFPGANSIWTQEVPNAFRIEEIIYYIQYIRSRGLLDLENRVFSRLIDFYRSPEKLKRMTGSFLEFMRNKKP